MAVFRTGRGGIEAGDEAALRSIVKDHKIGTLLEFGPGNSTRFFLEAGVAHIVTCEHHPEWRAAARAMFKDNARVHVLPYINTSEVVVSPQVSAFKFDAAFVDSPSGTATRIIHAGQEGLARYNTLRCALLHAPLVFLHDAKRPGEQASLKRLAAEGLACSYMIDTRKGIARIHRL